jgi:very-short-patch-repair endonuclease
MGNNLVAKGGTDGEWRVVGHMDPKVSTLSPDGLTRALAAKQNGVVYREQLLRAGLTPTQIRRRLGDGRLVALHRGVYLVGAVAPEWAYSQAGLFACGEGATLGQRSATRVWGLAKYSANAYPWVIVPRAKRIERPRIVISRIDLDPRDVRRRHGMRVTSPPRTVFDIASIVDDRYELEALVAEAAFRRLASEKELRDQIERNSGCRGVPALNHVLRLEGGPQRTRSDGERFMLRLLRNRGIKGFEVNSSIHGEEVDFLWRDEEFCIELDGWGGHSSRTAFERDRLKWAKLQAKGVAVMPITGRQVNEDEEGVFDRMLAVIAERRHRVET